MLNASHPRDATCVNNDSNFEHAATFYSAPLGGLVPGRPDEVPVRCRPNILRTLASSVSGFRAVQLQASTHTQLIHHLAPVVHRQRYCRMTSESYSHHASSLAEPATLSHPSPQYGTQPQQRTTTVAAVSALEVASGDHLAALTSGRCRSCQKARFGVVPVIPSFSPGRDSTPRRDSRLTSER